MKKIILLFTMIMAVAGVQAQSVHKLYATPMQVSGNGNISWDESAKQFSVTAAGANTYEIFSFPAGTLSKYDKIYIKIANTSDRVLFMNGTTIAFTWSGFGSANQKDQTLLGLNSNGENLTAEKIATITSIRIAGPGSGATISTPYTIAFNPAETYLYTASCEAMEVTTTINNSSDKNTPFAWTATGTLSDISNNLGKTNSSVIFGYASNNDAAHGAFDVTGYDRVKVTLSEFNSSNNTSIRLLAAAGSNVEFTAIANALTYQKLMTLTSCSSIKAGAGASNCQDVSSIEFSKYYGASETTPFNIAASASSSISYDRTFTAGKLSTVCLPFALDADEVTAAGEFYELNAATTDALTFTKVTTTEAYKPYIFKAKADGAPFSSLSDKAIDATAANNTTAGDYTFVGTLAASSDVQGDNSGKTVYGFKDGNFVKVSGSGVNIKAFRAYITGPAAGAREMLNINFGDESSTTAISEVKSAETNDGVAYNLNGQRVSNGHKGIVVKNGRKYVVK